MKPPRRFWDRLLVPAAVVAVCTLPVLPACSLLHRHPQGANGAASADASTDSSGSSSQPAMAGKRPTFRGLAVELKVAPDPVKLGEVRQVDVTLTLRNTSKQPVELKFAGSQIMEIQFRDQATGNIVSRWSTDQTFQPGSRYVVINPHERAEYAQPITTRELKVGRTYSLEAYFVGYDNDLHASRPIIPLP